MFFYAWNLKKLKSRPELSSLDKNRKKIGNYGELISAGFWLLLILNDLDSILGIARFDLLIDRGNSLLSAQPILRIGLRKYLEIVE